MAWLNLMALIMCSLALWACVENRDWSFWTGAPMMIIFIIFNALCLL